MAKKTGAAKAKARQAKLAKKDAKRKKHVAEVNARKAEAAAADRLTRRTLEEANDAWYGAEDEAIWLQTDGADASADERSAAVESFAEGLEVSCFRLEILGLSTATDVDATLAEFGVVFSARAHLGALRSLFVEAEGAGDPFGCDQAVEILDRWAAYAASDAELLADIAQAVVDIGPERVAEIRERTARLAQLTYADEPRLQSEGPPPTE